ncbi:MAG: ATP-binding protein [Candidatus Bathyarchaeota archaeon]|nr:MAG: ATP-binding protein [Candidatus Bathyarchaeota archaeon]
MSFVKHVFNKESPDQIQIADIRKLVKNETEESLHLDFEEIPRKHVKYDGLAEHISGFLNTSGGIIVFGVSERTIKGRNIPYKITWTTIKKETLENNLYRKIDPWYEDIQICPIQNPNDSSQKIFVIFVPKSKNPPHMANHIYYIRLNFQTQPLGHEQVSTIFRLNYLQKYELINTVYGPILNELTTYYNRKKIRKWSIDKYAKVCEERLYLLRQDVDLYLELDAFYDRISKWNKALTQVPFRLAKIINETASKFFKKQLYVVHGHSAVKLEVKAESTHQFPYIDKAVLNDEDPIDFWKEKNPFVNILEAKIKLELQDTTGRKDYVDMNVQDKEISEFMISLKKKVEKDELIKYIWKEFEEMQSLIETFFFEELEKRM